MASALSHAVAALGIGAAFCEPRMSKLVWVGGVLASTAPDLDVVGFRLGIRYGDFLGHRGFTHSLLFAAILAAVVAGVLRNRANLRAPALRSYLFLAVASHGLLDAMTDGGLGVAVFSPFDNGRYFLPWRPIVVSPIGISRFFSSRGLAVLESELIWIWLPAFCFAALALLLRGRLRWQRG